MKGTIYLWVLAAVLSGALVGLLGFVIEGVFSLQGRAVAMERKLTLSDQQLFISVVEVPERPQLAPQDFFWNGEVVATQHIKVLVTEG